jgi:monoamine oxidase
MRAEVTDVREGGEAAQVVVVGAGAAGLAAARELCAAGVGTLVLEARGRVGGRIHTLHDAASPVPVELGAEFIHGKARELWEVVERAGLAACDVSERHWHLERGGGLAESGEFWREIEKVFRAMKEDGRDLAFSEFVAGRCDDETAREAATLYVEGFHAAHAERAGTRGLVLAEKASESVEGDSSFRVLAGYTRVAEWLEREVCALGGRVLLETAVREIRWGRGRVEVVARRGDEELIFTATRAVVTLPLGVLQASPGEEGAVSFSPELREKLDAARRLEMGQAVRVALRFRTRFWESLRRPARDGEDDESLAGLGFLHASGAAVPTWWTQLPVRAPLLVGWAGGPRAESFAGRGSELLTARAVESLAGALGVARADVERELEAAYTHDWRADPFSRGAYAYLPVGGLTAQARLARPVEATLFFAGEATNSDGHIGTVHGAIATGRRAAAQVIESLG